MHRRANVPAALALVSFLALVLWAGETLFAAPRRALFDTYARLLPRERTANPVVIVAIDDASLRELGQWPWPRQRLAELIERILAERPLALGIDLIWPEPDRLSPRRWMREQGALPAKLEAELRALPDHDALLGAALGGGPVAIGVAGLRDASPDQPGPLAPVRVIDVESDPDFKSKLPNFTAMLRSLPVLDRGAPGHGLLTVDYDEDGLIRRMPMLATVAGRLTPSFGLEILRLAANAPWIDLKLRDGHILGVAAGPLAIATQRDAGVWPYFSPHDPSRFISAADVLAGRTPAGGFEQRLVVLGVTGVGLVDLPVTPLGPMPGSEIHAQLLEDVLADSLLSRPDWSGHLEAGLLAVLGALLILVLPQLSLRWWPPFAVLALAVLAATGFAAFECERWLVDIVTPATGIALVFVTLLGGTLVEANAQRRQLSLDLEEQRVAAARLEGELAAAARIQLGMVPQPSSLAHDPRFDLDAALVPARHVGGDFYDFLALDGDRLFFVIGDVSGKGLPASLFMALGKTLWKSCAHEGKRDVGAIVRHVDRELSRENPEQMFVTLFAGILDLSSGELCFCNAGHVAPFLVRAGDAASRLESVGGPPICTLDGFPYATETHRLEPEQIVCLFTDGVTDATDRAGELMGSARVHAALEGLPPGAGAREVRERVHRAVSAFTEGAGRFDDLALLTIRWSATAPDR